MSRLAAAIGHGVAERWKAFVGLVATVVIVFGAGVAAIAVWGEGGDVAGLTAIIGSLGLTWKGVGSTIGRGLAKVEQRLWDSQVDGAIADVITKLPSSDEDMIYLDALAESPEPVAGG